MSKALLALVLVTAGSVVAVTRAQQGASANEYFKSITSASPANRSWMADVPDRTSLAGLSVPGTHDTLSLCGYPTLADTDCDPLTTNLTKTQEDHGWSAETLTTQLEAGIRAIDIRVRVNRDEHGLSFTVHHGPYYQNANFTDVLTKTRDFLAANPRETVLLHLKAECEGGALSCKDAGGFATDAWRKRVLDSYLQGRAYTGTGDESNPTTAWSDLFWGPSVTGKDQAATPTLGEVRGKIVLLGFRAPKGGIYQGYGLHQPYPAGGSNEEYVQDEYEVGSIRGINDKWEKVRAHLRRANGVWDLNRGGEKEYPHKPDAIYINYTSGAGTASVYPATIAGGTPTANGVNEFLIQCLHATNGRCPEFYPNRPGNFGGRDAMDRTGIVMMDFPGGRLIDDIIARNPRGGGGDPDTPVNGGVGDPMEPHPGGDDGGSRPPVPGDHAACRPDGLTPTAGVNTPYCHLYQGDGREWLGQGRARRIVGYFNGARSGADGKPAYLVKNIPWSKVTHLNYAFAHIEGNRLSVGADGPTNPAIGMEWPGVPGAELDPGLPYKGHFNLLNRYKRLHPRVKTLISVGGWAESGGFYAMTTNADGSINHAGIDTFSTSAVDFLRRYGFDGVDIDFEYPTTLSDTGNPNDWDVARSRRRGLPGAYTVLMKSLREKLDRASATDGRYYLLTSASSASGFLVRGMENHKALRYQDFTNLMAYDFHGTWNDVVGPNAALYDDGRDASWMSCTTRPSTRRSGTSTPTGPSTTYGVRCRPGGSTSASRTTRGGGETSPAAPTGCGAARPAPTASPAPASAGRVATAPGASTTSGTTRRATATSSDRGSTRCGTPATSRPTSCRTTPATSAWTPPATPKTG